MSWWTPGFVIDKELSRVSELTTGALGSVLASHAPEALAQLDLKAAGSKDTDTIRSEMASRHARMVEALVGSVGRERALELGRAALFEVGRTLGKEARQKLKVGGSSRDLVRAARVLYRVLGIDFSYSKSPNGKSEMIVTRCALSAQYSELTCLVMSAADEGVVRGLNPDASLYFKERITSGCKECRAAIELGAEGPAR